MTNAAEAPRVLRLPILLSPQEHADLAAAAKADGRSLADYVRRAALRAARGER